MFYSFPLTVPSSTLETAPTEKIMRLTKGIVHYVSILFPTGCAGLVRVRIIDREHQVFPTNPDEWFSSNGETISFNDFYELDREPFNLRIEAYNEDDSFDHTVRVRIGILPKKVLLPTEEPGTTLYSFVKMFRRR